MKKYYVEIPRPNKYNDSLYLTKIREDGDLKPHIDFSSAGKNMVKRVDRFHFTKKEIRDIDPRFMAFAEPIQEV